VGAGDSTGAGGRSGGGGGDAMALIGDARVSEKESFRTAILGVLPVMSGDWGGGRGGGMGLDADG